MADGGKPMTAGVLRRCIADVPDHAEVMVSATSLPGDCETTVFAVLKSTRYETDPDLVRRLWLTADNEPDDYVAPVAPPAPAASPGGGGGHDPWDSTCRKHIFGEPSREDARCEVCRAGGYVAVPIPAGPGGGLDRGELEKIVGAMFDWSQQLRTDLTGGVRRGFITEWTAALAPLLTGGGG